MKGDTKKKYYNFSVKNVNFFKNALALLSVDDNKCNKNVKKSANNTVEGESCILFNIYCDGLMLRSLSKCKQIYCFLYLDSNCFTNYNIFEKENTHGEKKRRRTGCDNCKVDIEPDVCQFKNDSYINRADICGFPMMKRFKQDPEYSQSEDTSHGEEANSINSDNLYTTHAIDEESENVIKLKAVSPLKLKSMQYDDNESEYNIRKKIYEEIDDKKKNCVEFLVSPYELLRALEFLDPILLNIKFDYVNRKLILHLTDEDGDTSETFVRIIVNYYYEIYKLEKYSFLNNDHNYFSLQSTIFSFYLEYLIKNCDHCITFYISEYTDDSTTETKNKNYKRSVQLMPKENFEEFKTSKNQMYDDEYLQAKKISSHLRMDFQENGLLRFQFTLREYNMNGTHLCYFIQPMEDMSILNFS
ncbi:hypothetical protein, conserved [Plasmodium gonderi]|uniref:Uncharacterized protein n=1 Tax=Plasmodium gonderi TaxID=77519 RepID=A0A1Y1JLZ3_PLAGO|nr:hypothetical protein, conserved [Plasmodium gonderi]GAW82475.1 hypothetical protein, conserved [Plasmodium gonderi]